MARATTRESGSQVLALAQDAARVSRLRAAFGEALAVLDTPVRLLEQSRQRGVMLVFIPPCGPGGTSLVTIVAAIRASRQRAPTWVYGDRSPECLHALMPLARAGASGVVVRDVDDDVTSLRKLLDRGTLPHAVDTVSQVAATVVGPRHLPLVLACLDRVTTSCDASALARTLGVSQRTLSTWAAKLGTRGVRPLSSKCRVLVAIALLQVPGRTIEQVALELQFSSSAHLHNTIRRYTALAPRAAAARDLSGWCRWLLQPRVGTRPSLRLPPVETQAPAAEWSNVPNDTTLHPRTLTQ